MTNANSTPWYIDGRSGATVTYGNLLADLNNSPVSLRPLCQPDSTRDALREIAASVAFGTGLTLFDPDFGARELATLGFKKSQLNRPTAAPNSKHINSAILHKAAAGNSAAQLALFTSGSTGLPRLVRQSMVNLARAVKVSTRHAKAVWAFAYKPTHVAGIQVYLQALANSCPVVDIHGLDRSGALEAIERHDVTHLSATPSFYRLLLTTGRALAAVKSVTLGGESSDAALLDRLRPLFPSARIHNVYASTEAGTLLTSESDIFSIAAGLEKLLVVRDGRIQVHRSLLGEFVEPRAKDEGKGTHASSRSGGTTQGSSGPATSGSGEEWYDTGDVVEIVSTRPLRFRILARDRDWVNVGGSKVNPREVEAVLEEFPGVRRVRVRGRANSVLGHILCAEIECKGPLPDEPALREFAATRLQPFKIPRLIRFVDSIAQTRTGKISRQ